MTAARRLACLLLLVAAPALAQGPLEPSRLPPDTNLYFLWRGAGALEATRGTNALLRLWNDPEFAPVREALAQAFSAGAKKNQPLGSWKGAGLEQLLSLLENPMVGGLTGSFGIPPQEAAAAGGRSEPGKPFAFFVIYDATGKEEIFRKFLDTMLAAAKDRPTITSYAFGPTTVDKVVGPKETYYRAMVGHYAIRADKQAVMEDLITRLRSPQPPAASLEGVAAYQAARRWLAERAPLEFFGRIPDLSKIRVPAAEAFNVGAFVGALHLERFHAIVGSLSFPAEATRLRLAALGDTSPGSVFDLVEESTPTFATLPLAPAGTVYYSAGKTNLVAMYHIVRGALEAAFTPKQRTNMELVEALLANQINMQLPEALELLRGEVASMIIAYEPVPPPLLYAATIQDPARVLRLLRTIFAKKIASENQEGDTTYLTISSTGEAPQSGSRASEGYYLAVTPQMLIVASQKETLRGTVARLGSKGAAGASLGADPGFRRGRARLPERLSSLGYLDLTRVPWDKVVEGFQGGMKKAEPSASSSPGAAADALKATLPPLFRRYLHGMTSGTWKNRDGVYVDVYIE